MQISNTDAIKVVSVFCDYTADGLWIDGAADDLKGLCEDLGIPFDKELNDRLDAWQAQYEKWDFWSDEANPDEVYSSETYKKWDKEGREIARAVRDIVPDNIKVEYLDEETGIRITIPFKKKVRLIHPDIKKLRVGDEVLYIFRGDLKVMENSLRGHVSKIHNRVIHNPKRVWVDFDSGAKGIPVSIKDLYKPKEIHE